MTDEAALRAAVLAHPDDDTPRLVYADWCDDVGDADRAAFIRAQVEAARAEPWSPAQRDAQARAAEVKRSAATFRWVYSSHFWSGSVDFGRGFAETVRLKLSSYLTAEGDLFRDDPVTGLGIVRPTSWVERESLAPFFNSPELVHVRRLDLKATNLSLHEEYDSLATTPYLANLVSLSLKSNLVPPPWLTRVIAEGSWPNLVDLDLSGIPNLSPALVSGVQTAPNRRFKRLDLEGIRFLSGELQRLLSSAALRSIEQLYLGWAYPGPGPCTMIDLGWLLPWDRLRLIDLAGHHLGPDGVREVTDRPEAAGVRWLGLARNHIRDEGAKRLVESQHLHLYHLDVSGNDISPALLAALRARYPEAVVVG